MNPPIRPQTNPRYQKVDPHRLKSLLADCGIVDTGRPSGANPSKMIEWVSVYPTGECQLCWPLSMDLEITEGKILVGNEMHTAPCRVHIPSVQVFRILEPITLYGSFTMVF